MGILPNLNLKSIYIIFFPRPNLPEIFFKNKNQLISKLMARNATIISSNVDLVLSSIPYSFQTQLIFQ